MAKNKTVTLLKKDGYVQAIFTNSLACFEQMKALTPSEERDRLPSYSTINRIVREAGDSKAVATSVGVFIIQKLNIYRKAFQNIA